MKKHSSYGTNEHFETEFNAEMDDKTHGVKTQHYIPAGS